MALLEEIKVPLLAVNDTTLTVVELSCPPGTKVEPGRRIMVFETSKTTYDVEAHSDGFIQYCCIAGQDYTVNEVVARIFSEADEALSALVPTRPAAFAAPMTDPLPAAPVGTPAFPSSYPQPIPGSEPRPHWEGETLFSSDAARLIKEHGLAVTMFSGRDLISASDVLQLLRLPVASPPAEKEIRRSSTAIAVDPNKAVAAKLLSGKKREIDYLGDVQSAGLTSTIHTFIETDGIFTHMNRSLRYLRNSLLPVIIYEVSRLLTDYPLLNAYFTGDGIAQYKAINPGFAIDIDKGLKVARIAAAGEKSMQEIESAILALSGDYLDDTLKLEDLVDITFTITDLSAEAVSFFKPLINKMNSAILGISAIDEKLQRCTLSLTFDHRVTEGRTAARFLKDLKQRLESYRAPETAANKNIAC
ncbi:MAG TPA: 2-oxo acid dehydrogenase subunit E2, partial [Puia sp.]|nr:2-oxo acid dehydrogenase subunit E2 [Puia sp.]